MSIQRLKELHLEKTVQRLANRKTTTWVVVSTWSEAGELPRSQYTHFLSHGRALQFMREESKNGAQSVELVEKLA